MERDLQYTDGLEMVAMGSVGGRIKAMLDGLPITQKMIADQLGVAPNTVKGYLDRDVLNTDTLEKLAVALTELCAAHAEDQRFTASSLLEGREDLPLRPSAETLMFLGGATGEEIARVFAPCYGTVPCGHPIVLDDPPESLVDLSDVTQNAYRPGECYLLQATGDSMVPLIRSGDWLIVNRNRPLQPQQIGVFVLNGATTIKRYILHPETGEPALKPENSQLDIIELTESDEVECQGVVVAVTRTIRTV